MFFNLHCLVSKKYTIFYTKDEFINWLITNDTYLKLHKKWVDSGYDKIKSPSIDRLNEDAPLASLDKKITFNDAFSLYYEYLKTNSKDFITTLHRYENHLKDISLFCEKIVLIEKRIISKNILFLKIIYL